MSPLALLSLLSSCFLGYSANPISPKLPFMLFASDFVSEIQFPSPTCVFVNAAQQTNISKVTFTPENPGGEVVNANSFLHDVKSRFGDVEARFGVHCFDNATLNIRIDYGGLFAGLNKDSVEWRSAIFFFMEKAKVKNVCAGRGTQKLGGNIFAFSDYESRNEDIAVHAACPIVLLTPTGMKKNPVFKEHSNCPTVTLQNHDSNDNVNFPDDLRLDVSTVPHGLKNLSHLELFTLTNANLNFAYSEVTFLRSAVLLRSNQPRWIEKVIFATNNDGEMRVTEKESNKRACNLDRPVMVLRPKYASGQPSYIGYLDSDPLGSENVSFLSGVYAGYKYAFVELNISAYNPACCSLTLAFIYSDFTPYNIIQNLTGIHRFDAPFAKGDIVERGFMINITRMTTKACENENLRLFYSVGQMKAPETKTTTKAAPTTTTSTSSASTTSILPSTAPSPSTSTSAILSTTTTVTPATPSHSASSPTQTAPSTTQLTTTPQHGNSGKSALSFVTLVLIVLFV